jgi:hypothetical protein
VRAAGARRPLTGSRAAFKVCAFLGECGGLSADKGDLARVEGEVSGWAWEPALKYAARVRVGRRRRRRRRRRRDC